MATTVNRVQSRKGHEYRVKQRTSAEGVTPMTFELVASINTNTALSRTYEATSEPIRDLNNPGDAGEMERNVTSVDTSFTAAGRVDDRDIDALRAGVGKPTYFRIEAKGKKVVQGEFLYSVSEAADWDGFANVELSFEQYKTLDWEPEA